MLHAKLEGKIIGSISTFPDKDEVPKQLRAKTIKRVVAKLDSCGMMKLQNDYFNGRTYKVKIKRDANKFEKS